MDSVDSVAIQSAPRGDPFHRWGDESRLTALHRDDNSFHSDPDFAITR